MEMQRQNKMESDVIQEFVGGYEKSCRICCINESKLKVMFHILIP